MFTVFLKFRNALCCFRIYCSSSLHEGYDEPEILRCSIPQICPKGADVRQWTTSAAPIAASSDCRAAVTRIWRREGLKVPPKQPKKRRLWLNDGSCVRIRPERPNHFCSNDFVQDLTHDGRIFRTLNIIDEFTKEALVIRVKRKLNSTDVLDALPGLADPRLHSA